MTGAPGGRALHVLAWSGSELLVWGGGASSGGLSSGGRYTPASDAWIPTAEAGAPAARLDAHSAWTGSRLLVWSGISPGVLAGVLGDGAFFDPATDVWTPVPTAGSTAAARRASASVWTGSELVVWGGDGGATGARFTP